jgi:ABC-type bacteriocin/lantibiotic exporter with double-glycine peptidase domain
MLFLKKLNKVIPSKAKKKIPFVALSSLLNSVFEVIGLAALLPLLAIMLDKSAVSTNKYLGVIYHTLNIKSHNHFVLIACGFIILFILFKNALSIAIQYFHANFSFDVYHQLTEKAYKHYLGKDFLYIKSTNSNTVFRDVRIIPRNFTLFILMTSISMANDILVILIMVTGIIFYNTEILLLIVLIVFPTFYFFYKKTKNQIKEIGLILHHHEPKISNTLYQSIFGYVDIFTAGKWEYFRNKYINQNKEVIGYSIKNSVLQSLPPKVLEFSMILSVIVLVIYGTFFLKEGTNLATLVTIFGITAYRVLPSINRIMGAMLTIKHYSYVLDSLLSINGNYSKQVSLQEPTHQEPLDFNNIIEIRNLSFSYPESQELVLDNINFVIKKGESVGIIGRSGSGKTTLINIILRLLKESKGGVYVDNIKLSDCNERSWLNKIGYVQQEVYLLDASIAENIAFGVLEKEIDIDKLNTVLKSASLSKLVEELPQGINTILGERGTRLSGGQRQRIGVARALYSGAEILFLDEATSALDSQTENEITESIKLLTENRLTIIVIAHRFTTLKYCDKILKFENGKLMKSYSYPTLMEEELGV